MENIVNFIKEGQLFIVPLCVLIITQIIKTVTDVIRKKRFKFSYLTHYGGMPSSHTALFVSLATITYFIQGWQSPIFAVALIICIIMVRDALGLRYHLGNHGYILKQLIEEQEQNGHSKLKYHKIITRLGHTPKQVFFGALLGFILTAGAYYLLMMV